MKILQIANKLPYPPKDGGSIATLSLSRAFAELGHDVTVLAMNTSKHFTDPENIPAALKTRIRFIAVPVDTGIKPLALAANFMFSKLPYNAVRFVSREFEAALEDLLVKESFDVVQLEGLYTAPYIKCIRKHSDALVAMRAHNIEHEIWQRSVQQHAGLKRFYIRHLAGRIRSMETSYLASYDALLPITRRDGDILRSMGCTVPVHVVPTGIDGHDLPYHPGEIEFPSVFHIGALDWMPNREGLSWFLEKVWPLVIEKLPALKLYVAGRNASPHYVKSILRENTEFLGEIDDARAFMGSKAIMIVPLLSGSGMRIKIVEGMGLGKAIVTTSIGTEGIATSHGENIFIADDPAGFAGYICHLAENRSLVQQIGENARKFVLENFDNKAITAGLIKFFEERLNVSR